MYKGVSPFEKGIHAGEKADAYGPRMEAWSKGYILTVDASTMDVVVRQGNFFGLKVRILDTSKLTQYPFTSMKEQETPP